MANGPTTPIISFSACHPNRYWRLTLLPRRVINFGMIRSFRDDLTRNIFRRERVIRFSREVQRAALRKLVILDAAESLDDLRIPPGNRLEKLKGDRKDQYSVRLNDQWRICFVWTDGDAYDVEITDYH